MSVSFRSSRLQLTTVAGYRMNGTAKVLIAVTLFLLESLLLRARLTRFLYSEMVLQRTSSSLFDFDFDLFISISKSIQKINLKYINDGGSVRSSRDSYSWRRAWAGRGQKLLHGLSREQEKQIIT